MQKTKIPKIDRTSETLEVLKQFKEGDRVLETIAQPTFWILCCVKINRWLLQWWYTQERDKPSISRIAMSIIEPQKPTFKIGLKRVGCIYLIEAVGTNRFKVGRSSNLDIRIEQLRNQSPYPLKIVKQFNSLDSITEEALLHKLLAPTRIHGEWFSLNEPNFNLFLKFHFRPKTFDAVGNCFLKQWIQVVCNSNPLLADSLKIETSSSVAIRAKINHILDIALIAGQFSSAMLFMREHMERLIPTLIIQASDFVPVIYAMLAGFDASVGYTLCFGLDSADRKTRIRDEEGQYLVHLNKIWEVDIHE
ncbi:MAG: GIY-YIG nuclease family protein [Chroococcidiopsis sp.]